MSTTFRITTVALAAALCWQAPAHAATATEAQLRSVTLYADVSIQQDSTSSWGPWAEFEAPAAGNTQPVAAPRAANEPYRPLPQTGTGTSTPPELPPIVEGFCAGGSICGFGAFAAADPNPNDQTASDINPFRLNGSIVTGTEGEGSLLPEAVQLNATVLSPTGSFQLANSGQLDLTAGEGNTNFAYSREVRDGRGRPLETYVLSPDFDRVNYDPQANQAINFNLVTYVRGNTQSGWGVIGYTTPTADMAALRGTAQATYNGSDYYGNAVAMTVNFTGGANGQGTWSGTWNGGSDGTVSTQASASGTILTGQVGFTAAGNIQGSTFTSTSVGTNDARGSVTGSVQGAFFGRNAAAAGGVVDITKTMQPSPQQQPAAVQVNPGQGYTGRYVAPFIATKNGNGV